MEWIDTPDSSNIVGFGYDESCQVLTVEFKNGGRYSYYDVPAIVAEGMITAGSKGQYLAQHIKGQYRYART